MREALGVELLRSLGVALSSAHVRTLVVTDGPTIRAATALCA